MITVNRIEKEIGVEISIFDEIVVCVKKNDDIEPYCYHNSYVFLVNWDGNDYVQLPEKAHLGYKPVTKTQINARLTYLGSSCKYLCSRAVGQKLEVVFENELLTEKRQVVNNEKD